MCERFDCDILCAVAWFVVVLLMLRSCVFCACASAACVVDVVCCSMVCVLFHVFVCCVCGLLRDVVCFVCVCVSCL